MNLRKEPKDLDAWIGKPLKVLLHEDGFYEGILMAEQKNGLLLKHLGKEFTSHTIASYHWRSYEKLLL